MHEAGIARAIAETLRTEGWLGVPVRVLVTGGHDEPAAFDASLLLHLELAAPEVDLALVSVVHLPSGRWCPSCGHRFEAVGEVDCPVCGSATMGSQMDERIEIERVDGPGSSDPSDGADRPSGAAAGEAHDGPMEPIAIASPDQHEHGHDATERPDDRVT